MSANNGPPPGWNHTWQREYLGTIVPPSSPSLDWAKAVQAERDMRRETARHYGIAIMAEESTHRFAGVERFDRGTCTVCGFDADNGVHIINPDRTGGSSRESERGFKHGPRGSGRSGPCDVGCLKCAWEAKVDPLDAVIDGVMLRHLLQIDQELRRETKTAWAQLSSAQRAAVSAHWSAELRAKVEAGRKADEERERSRVVVDLEDL